MLRSLLAALLFAGCLQAAPSAVVQQDVAATPCEGEGRLAFAPGLCGWTFDPDGFPDGEADVAVHGREPASVLVTWHSNAPSGWTTWAALSRDAGATWRVTRLTSPIERLPSELPPHDFDSTAAFLPDGRAAVLFGTTQYGARGAPGAYAGTGSTMTLAMSDDAETWEYRTVAHSATVDLYDYMDLAVGPDDGTLHVVAMRGAIPDFLGVGAPASRVVRWSLDAFRSVDGGQTWEARTLWTGTASAYDEVEYGPRVAAASGGAVVVGATAGYVDGSGFLAYVSLDGGRTFERRTVTTDGSPWGAVAAAAGPEGSRAQAVLWREEREITLHTSSGGEAWSTLELASPPASARTHWATVASRSDGGSVVLVRWRDADARASTVELFDVAADGGVTSRRLDASQGADQTSDHYGGVAVAEDGTTWAAWMHVRTDTNVVAVAALRR